MTPLRRASILCIAMLTLAIGLGLDLIYPGGDPGIGPLQIEICVVGLAGVLLGVLPVAARTHYARVLLALSTTYLSAFVVEVMVMPPLTHWGLVNWSQKGMVRPSSWGGFELTPGWQGRYEDGVDRVDVAINALGDRDDPPSPRDEVATERLLLLGDSFAFGWGLQKRDTVEGQIESAGGGRAVAYNLGVGGYGPADTLEHYREHTAFQATHTFFLLYGNDLRIDNCTAGFHTAVDGVIVPRTQQNGIPYTPEDVERRLATARKEDDRIWLTQIKSALALTQLRSRLTQLIRHDYPLAAGSPEQYTPECAIAAAERADEMRQIARARGQRFAVVVLPTPGETHRDIYADWMQACIRELERRSITVIEVREQLELSDFFAHHEHLNPSGTHKVAQAILASVESPTFSNVSE